MYSLAAAGCVVPVCDAGGPARAHVASDDSTEADSGAEELPSVPRAVTGGSRPNGGMAGGSGVASWQLVWCHERCHKEDCDKTRAAIDDAAGGSQASLLCLKKAAKYAAWLDQARRPPHALLTDWREVKPCLQAAALHPPCNRPVLTVILCELPKHYERAAAWAQALPARDRVRLCRSAGLLKGLLQELAGQSLAGLAVRSRQGALQGPPGQFSSVAGPPLQRAMTQATGYGVAAWATSAGEDVEKDFEAVRRQRDAMWLTPVQALPWGATVSSPLAALGSPGGVEQCGFMVAAPPSPSSRADLAEDSQMLEAMLMSAMPDHYDD